MRNKFRLIVSLLAMLRKLRLLLHNQFVLSKMVARDVIGDCHDYYDARAGKSIYPSNEYTIVIFPLENLLRVIVTVVLVVDILLQVVVGVGLLKVLAEGSVSRVSTS